MNYLQYLGKKLMGTVPDEKRIKEACKLIEKSVKMIESHFLNDTLFINSNEITIADLQALCELTQFWLVDDDIDPLRDRPKLKEWLERCRRILNPSFDKVHAMLYRSREKGTFKSKL